MRRLLLILLVIVLTTVIHSVATAQTAAPTTPCLSDQEAATLRRRVPATDNKTVTSQAGAQKPGCTPQRIEFHGLTAITESDALKLLRERGALSQDHPFQTEVAATALKEVLASRGYPNVQVQSFNDGQDTMRLFVDEGKRIPLAALRFEGNKIFSSTELSKLVNRCHVSLNEGPNSYHKEKLEYCERVLLSHLRGSGYLEAKSRQTPSITERGYVVTFEVDEGTLYRLGKVKIGGLQALTEEEVKSGLSLREGDIADGEKIAKWLFETLKKAYGELGFIQYTADLNPTFKRQQGTVDLEIVIEEGKQYSLRSITFLGELIKSADVEHLLLLRAGDVYNDRLMRESIARLGNSGLYAPVDPDRDVEFKSDDEDALVSLVIKLKKRE